MNFITILIIAAVCVLQSCNNNAVYAQQRRLRGGRGDDGAAAAAESSSSSSRRLDAAAGTGNPFGSILPVQVGITGQQIIDASPQDMWAGIKTNTLGDSEVKQASPFVYHSENIINEVNKNSYSKSTMIRRESDVTNAIDIGGSISASLWPLATVSASVDYLHNTTTNSNRVVVLFTQRYSLFSKRPNRYDVTAHAQTLVGTDPEAFADRYGTRFIGQILYGAQLDMSFTVTSQHEISHDEIRVELQEKVGLGPFSVSFKQKFETSSTHENAEYHLDIKKNSFGIETGPVQSDNFEDANRIIQEFNDNWAKIENGTIPLEDRYNSLKPVAVTIVDTSQVIRELPRTYQATMEEKLSQNGDVKKDTLYWNGKLESMKTDLNDHKNEHPMYEEVIQQYLDKSKDFQDNVLHKKANECQEFQSQSVHDLVNGTRPIPSLLTDDNYIALDGFLGNGYIDEPTLIDADGNNATYAGMYWEGYVIDDEPFFRGTLHCAADESPIGEEDFIDKLIENISEDACSSH